MFAKVLLFVCAQVLFLKSISGQCTGRVVAAEPLAVAAVEETAAAPIVAATIDSAALSENSRLYGSLSSPLAVGALTPSIASASHGVFPVTSVSVIAPNGVTVTSENAYDGELTVSGALPFLGTMSLEGALPNIGTGTVAFNCGNGAVAILGENIGASGIAGPLGYRGDILGYGGYNAGAFGRAGCGCRALI